MDMDHGAGSGSVGTGTGSTHPAAQAPSQHPSSSRGGLRGRGALVRGRGTSAGVRGGSARGAAVRGGMTRGARGGASINRTLHNNTAVGTSSSSPASSPTSANANASSGSSPPPQQPPRKLAPQQTFANKSAVFNSKPAQTTQPQPNNGMPVSAALPAPPQAVAFSSPISSPAHLPTTSSSLSDLEEPKPPRLRSLPPQSPFHPSTNQHTSSSDESDDEARKRRFDRKAAIASTNSGNKWLQMKAERPALRQQYIDSGVLPDPDKPRQLSQATRFVGTCMEMCPEFEREEREFQGEGDELEVFAGTTKLDPQLAVKIYRRPAAGRELPLPDDVRPPAILKMTLDYLFHSLLPASPASPHLANVQGFIWNRTRAIRQDFIVQGQAGALTIECHERIARWHILSLHWKGGSIDADGQPRAELPKDRDPWSQQQELEQLAKTLTSLNEFYDDLRLTTGKPNPSPNEAEFRAYHLILNLYDPEVLRSVEILPEQVFDAEILQTAIALHGYAQRSNRGGSARANALNTDAPMNFFSRFFRDLKSPHVSYLLACICENKFTDIRQGAFKSLCANYNKVHRGPTAHFVKEALGADTEVQVIEWAEAYGIEVQMENDHTTASLKLNTSVDLLDVFKKAGTATSTFSKTIVESKRSNWTSQQIVDGVASGAAPLIKVDAGQARVPMQPTVANPSLPVPSVSAQPAKSSLAAAQNPKMSPFATSFTPGVKPSGATTTTAFGGSSSPALSPSTDTKNVSTLGGPTSHGATAFGSSASTSPFAAPPSSSSAFGGSAAPQKVTAPSSEKPSMFASQKDTPAPSAFSLGQSSSFGGSFAFKSAAAPTHTAFGGSMPPVSKPPAPAAASVERPSSGFRSFTANGTSAIAFQSPPSASTEKAQPATQPPASQPPATQSTAKAPTLAPTPAFKPTPAKETKVTAPRKASHTITDDRQARRVYHELVRLHAEKIAKEALRKEHERRRREARAYFIETIAQRLYSTLCADALQRTVPASIAMPVLADEVYRRTQLTHSFDKWEVTLAQRLEAQKQRDRLEEVRREVQRRGLLDRHAGGYISTSKHNGISTHSLRSSLDGDDDDTIMDDELTASVRRGATQRASLWSEGSFTVAIASHIANLVTRFRPSGMGSWSACVSLPPEHEDRHGDVDTAVRTSSSWLKRKFGLDDSVGGRSKTIPVAPQVDVRVELAGGADDTVEDTALVVMCLAPGSDGLLEERSRLATLSAREHISRSRYETRLLILAWDSTPDADILRHLDVGRHGTATWKSISILHLNGGKQNPDEDFSKAVASLVTNISFNPRKHPVLLSEVITPLRRPWSDAVGNAQTLLVRLVRYLNLLSDDDAATRIKGRAGKAVLEAFVTLVALANYGFDLVTANSETLLESEDAIALPRLSVDEILHHNRNADPNTVLYTASQILFSRLTSTADPSAADHTDSSTLLLAQALLLQAQRESRPFPLSALLEHLYAHTLSRLESNWLQADREHIVPLVEKESQKVSKWAYELGQLFSRGVTDVVEAIREWQRLPSDAADETLSRPRKRKNEAGRSSFGGGSVGGRPQVKSSRISP